MNRFFSQIPQEHRSNFINLYLDMAWFGVLTGSTVSFLSVYMVRVGASGFQIGLMSASPALITMISALPAGRWLKNRSIDNTVFATSVFNRLFYALLVPVPVLFGAQLQTWVVIAITLMMSIPGTVFAVGYNALFAQAVPADWRNTVSGVRNALLAIATTLTTLICGYLLERLSFPQDYQFVFFIGFLGAAMSSLHLRLVRVSPRDPLRPRAGTSMGGLVHPGLFRSIGDTLRSAVGLRFLRGISHPHLPSLDLLKSSYGLILIAFFIYHFMIYLAIPLYPMYYVDALGLSDQQISLGNALYYAFIFLSSLQLGRVIKWVGLHKSTALGALLISVFPGLLAISRNYEMFLFATIVAGIVSSLAGVAMSNYLLEIIPADDRPIYLAWYTMTLNAAILIGSLSGPFLSQWIGLVAALIVVMVGRVLAAFGIWIIGKNARLTTLRT